MSININTAFKIRGKL